MSELGLRSVGSCTSIFARSLTVGKPFFELLFYLKTRNFPLHSKKKEDSGSVFVSFSKFMATCLIMLVKLRKLDLIASFCVTLYPPCSLSPAQEAKTSTLKCVTELIHAG